MGKVYFSHFLFRVVKKGSGQRTLMSLRIGPSATIQHITSLFIQRLQQHFFVRLFRSHFLYNQDPLTSQRQ